MRAHRPHTHTQLINIGAKLKAKPNGAMTTNDRVAEVNAGGSKGRLTTQRERHKGVRVVNGTHSM